MNPKHARIPGTNPWLVVAIAMGLCALTIWLRLGMVEGTLVDTPLRADAGGYYSAAYNLKRFGVLSTSQPDGTNQIPPADAVRVPGYPLFLLPFVVYPPDLAMTYGIATAQALLGGLTILLVFSLLRPLLPLSLAATAALLTAISPHLIAADVYVLTESVFTCCLMLFTWTLWHLARDPRHRSAFIAGAALGLTALVRETTTYLPVILAAGLFALFPARTALRLLAPFIIGFALIYGPWVARNHLNPEIAQGSTQALGSILGGTYLGLMYNNDPASRGMPHRFDPHYAEIDTWGKLMDRISTDVDREPARYLSWYLIGKPTMFLSWDYVAGWGDVYVYPIIWSPYFTDPVFMALHQLMRWLHVPLTLLALIGTLLAWMPSARATLPPDQLAFARMMALIVLYFIVLHMVATPLPRYATPLRPLLFAMAMFALWGLTEPWRRWRSQPRTPGANTGGATP